MKEQDKCDVDSRTWKYPQHYYERNSILEVKCHQAPGDEGLKTINVEFGDGRALTADAALLPALLQVMGVERLEDLAAMDIEVASEPLPGFAKLQDTVFVFPTEKLWS